MTFYCTPCRMQVMDMDSHRRMYHPEEAEIRDLRARLAAVEALCDEWFDNPESDYYLPVVSNMVRAVLRGEGDLPAERMLADVKREHAKAWRDEVRPNLGPVSGEGDQPARRVDFAKVIDVNPPLLDESGEGDRPAEPPSAALVQTVREMYTDTPESHMPGWTSGEGDRGPA